MALSCKDIPDSVLLERYADRDVRVPSGLYYEPTLIVTTWELPCSDSLENTLARFALANLGAPEVQSSTDWFYEVSYCFHGARRLYRNLRCSYFDGSRLFGGVAEFPFLVGLLYWSENYNFLGQAILGYNVTSESAGDSLELCTLSAGRGDWGECDKISLDSTIDTIASDGTVQLGTPVRLRTIDGTCYPYQ
jgi:hypothetical protein